ncbi:MAG: carboxylating nicotinate-nucleotide diphosphorylase [Desulfatibacillum sp.]|nr:carboxylating nicotinate-nucleotide diphosphorylase [Desulfatibacillum sp.]
METKDKTSGPAPGIWRPGLEASNIVKRLVNLALEEDLATGDITTDPLVPPDRTGTAIIKAKENLLVAGMDMVLMVFDILDPAISIQVQCQDGAHAKPGDVLATLTGRLRPLLWGERTALNFLQRLCGIATHTHSYMQETHGLDVKLADTRKTTPGWRLLEKYAVRVGGAANHRMGLFDGILIKDNHIVAAGGITRAVILARQGTHHLLRIEVEVATMEELREALDAKADVIMLDNMDAEQIRQAVALIDGRALVEVSGGIRRETIREMARAGVDILSCGALTHAARAVDISMKITV